MKRNLRIIFLISGFFLDYQAKAQIDGSALTKLTPVKVPEAYKSPKGKIEPKNCQRITASSDAYNPSYWIVYSDRDDNQTYKDKNLSQPYSKADFKEMFFVAEETDQTARLVVCNLSEFAIDDKGNKPSFKPTARDAGWISKSKLLLWSNCLVDSATNYAKKALAVKKLKNDNDYNNLIKRGVLDFYNVPDTNKNYENDKDVKLFQYLFIFKEEKNMSLLGNINVLKPGQFTYNVYGWVSNNQIQEWTSAICLRINFEQSAVDERESSKPRIEPQFFRTEKQAIEYKQGKKPTPMIFNYSDPSDETKKDNPYLLGYPITATTSDPTVFKTGYVTNTINSKGYNVFTAMTTAKLTQQFEGIKSNKEKANIVFVLDGANRSFYKTLAKALEDLSMIGSATLTSNKYQFGAVIFDNQRGGENEGVTKIKFQSNKDNFIDKLKNEGSNQVDVDRGTGAPISNSIKSACDFFDNGKTTNIIIVVGSVTDNNSLQKETALNELAEKNVKLFFYQVLNKAGRYYDNYQRECKYFLERIAEASDVEFTTSIKSGERKKAEMHCEGPNCKLINTAVAGEYHSKEGGAAFTDRELGSSLKSILSKLEEGISRTKATFDENIVGTGKNVSSSLSTEEEDRIKEFQSWLHDEHISQETIDKLAKMDNYQLFIEGYAALKPTNVVNQIFERNLFMGEHEFQKLEYQLDKLNNSYTSIDKREEVVKTCKEIILSYKGPMDESRLARYSFDDVWNLVTTLPSNNQLFKKSLKAISDPKQTPDPEIDKMKTSINNVYLGLKSVKKNPRNRYETEDQFFYWVPESKLSVSED
ncbi:MAG TPA: type VI secretion system protein TssR domain-containing protein [Bacteroidia bacterium]|nr:type VI secretion system protein TssR domain-containing protein [Bacteroidia bacterium]